MGNEVASGGVKAVKSGDINIYIYIYIYIYRLD